MCEPDYRGCAVYLCHGSQYVDDLSIVCLGVERYIRTGRRLKERAGRGVWAGVKKYKGLGGNPRT